MVVFKEV